MRDLSTLLRAGASINYLVRILRHSGLGIYYLASRTYNKWAQGRGAGAGRWHMGCPMTLAYVIMESRI
jgi:hypothetical protein